MCGVFRVFLHTVAWQLYIMTILPLPFQFGYLFIFSCLTAVAKTYNTILDRIGENGHPCLVPDFSRKFFSFLQLSSIVLACEYVISNFYYAKICSFYTHFGKSFCHEWTLNLRQLPPHSLHQNKFQKQCFKCKNKTTHTKKHHKQKEILTDKLEKICNMYLR